MNQPPRTVRAFANRVLGVAALVALGLMPAKAAASDYVFTPVADARVNAASPGSNYGKTKTLVFDATPENRGYLRFDLRGVEGNVTQATLSLRALTDNGGSPLGLRGLADTSWTETQIDFGNAPAVGPVVAGSGPLTSGERFLLDATSLVDGDGAVGFAVTSSSTRAAKVDTREVFRHTPKLIVETDAPEDPVVAAAGDIACDPTDPFFNGGEGRINNCRQRAVAELMVNRDLTAILPVGDLQYEDASLAQFNGSYDPSWGLLRSITRPVPGDGEYDTPAAAGYFDYFNGVGNLSGPAGTRSEGYYSYEIGSWHVVALNSNCDEVGGCGQGSPQNAWLEADLAAHPSSCILAYFHHPRFTSVGKDTPSVAPFWEDLYAAGTDLVLSGSDHAYERFARQSPDRDADPAAGIRQIIVGTGGASHESGNQGNVANSGIRERVTFGVTELTLRDGSYDWRFVPESRGTFSDAGSDTCTGSTVDTEPPATPATPAANPVGANRVELSWPATTDNDGVARYHVLRDGVDIGTTGLRDFADTTAAPGQSYEYRVVATDAVGNDSVPSAPATATTGTNRLVFTPVDDATVAQGSPTRNFGADAKLEVDATPREETLLKFDVAGVGAAQVAGVTLCMHGAEASVSGGAVRAVSDDSWDEDTVTWSSAPAASPGELASFGAIKLGADAEVTLPNSQAADGLRSFRVISQSSDGGGYSSSETSPLLEPRLIVDLD